MTDTITLPRAVVEQAQMWISLLAKMAGLDPETTSVEFGDFTDGRPASTFTIAGVITLLRAALEQPQAQSGGIPAGWKLVPRNITDAMYDAWVDDDGDEWTAYQAMLAAAPQPPALEQPQVEQEPVAQVVPCYTPSGKRVALNTVYQDLPIGTKLYTHQQPPRHPLTDEQINLIDDSTHFHESPDWSLRFARAIERAHGIGGEK